MVRTFDEFSITEVVRQCFDDIVEDDTPYSAFKIDFNNQCWLKVSDSDGLIGFYQLIPLGKCVLDVHPYILKNRRVKSLDSAFAVKKWFNSDKCPEMYKSLVTKTASFNRHIKILLLKVGFEMIGEYKNSFKKCNIFYNTCHYQLMRGE